jgi:hypothetical protein
MGTGLSKQEADKYYQAKGDYLTQAMVKDHLTKQLADSYYQTKGDYITRTIADTLYQPKTNVMSGDMTSQQVTNTVQQTISNVPPPAAEQFRFLRKRDIVYYV